MESVNHIMDKGVDVVFETLQTGLIYMFGDKRKVLSKKFDEIA